MRSTNTPISKRLAILMAAIVDKTGRTCSCKTAVNTVRNNVSGNSNQDCKEKKLYCTGTKQRKNVPVGNNANLLCDYST